MDPVRHDSIGAAVRRSALRVPRKIALRFGERSWTYEALDRGANRIARALLEAGLEPGARLAAYGRNSDAYFLTWLGCVRAGVIHVPVNYALRPDELGYIVRQCGAAGVVCDEALSANVTASADASAAGIHGRFHGGGAALDMLSAALDERIDGAAIDVPNAEGIAQILYTSGTTAEPKGAVMTHAAFLTHYASCMVAADMNAADRTLDALPLYHAAQMHAFFMPHVLLGATAVLIEAPEPALVLRLDRRASHHVVLRAADRLDRIAAARRFRPARPDQPGARVLRRVDHAGAGARGAPAAAAVREAVQRLRPERDRSARGDAASRGARRAAGIRRASRAERRDARRRRADERRSARRPRRDRAPLAAAHAALLGQARRDGAGIRGRLVPLGRRRVARRGRLSLRHRPRERHHQHRRRRGVQPRRGRSAVHAPERLRVRGDRAARSEVDRSGDGRRRPAPGHERERRRRSSNMRARRWRRSRCPSA